VEKLAAEFDGQAVVAKLNVDESPKTPATLSIMGIPTLIYFKNGKEVDRVVGVQPYQQLARRLQALV
jgi:thioredoxin 1